jgi:hypothetical protein
MTQPFTADKASTIAEREYYIDGKYIEAPTDAAPTRVRVMDPQRSNRAAMKTASPKGKPAFAEAPEATDAGTPRMTPPPSTLSTIAAKPTSVSRPSATKNAVLITTTLGKDGRYHVVTKHADVDAEKLVTVMGPTGKLFQRDPSTGALYYHGRAVSEKEEKEDHLKVEDLPPPPESKEAPEPDQG